MIKLTESQKALILKTLIERGATLNCSACLRSGTMAVADVLAAIHTYTPESILKIGPDIFPNVALTCGVCGNMRFHNVLTLGLQNDLGVPVKEP